MLSVPPEERALRLFDHVVDWTGEEGLRGCPVQHVIGEIADRTHPALILAVQQREWLIEHFTEWARAAGALDPSLRGFAPPLRGWLV